MSRLHLVTQYTKEWWEVRRGVPTASQFHRIVTPAKCQLSAQHKQYLYELVAERLLGHVFASKQAKGEWVEHGAACEPDAVDAFQAKRGAVVERIGFVTTNDGRPAC